MRSFLVALQFLTRIQLVRQEQLTVGDFGRSTRCFPLVGVVLGFIYMLTVFVTAGFLPWENFNVTVWLLVTVILTGGLHYDGFMDTVDGLFSGRSRERMLEIMRDSRVGSFGALAAMCLLLFNWTAMRDIPILMSMTALFVMPIIGRMAMVLAIYAFPYARPEGMGKAFADMVDKKAVSIAGVTTALFVLPWGQSAALALFLGIGFGLLLAAYIARKLGGLTGDAYGAVELLTESFVLFVFLWVPHLPGGMEILWR